MKYLKTIYSFQFPEVKNLVGDLWSSKPHYLFDKNYEKKQEGKELEFFNIWHLWSAPIVDLNINDFPFSFPTAGSSEAIRECIWQLKIKNKRLVVFEGDYEGYSAFARSAEIQVVHCDREKYEDFSFTDKDVIFLSNPSSIDGSFWKGYDLFMSYMETNYPNVLINVDVCYVGTTKIPSHKINLNYKNINHIFMSLSKAYGVYFHRIGGVISKTEISGLYGNKWFKNMMSLELGIKLMNHFPVTFFSDKYDYVRQEVIDQLEKDLNIKTKETDVFVLVSSSSILSEYKRGKISRICLTPALDEHLEYHRLNPILRETTGLEVIHPLNILFQEFKNKQLKKEFNDLNFYTQLYYKAIAEYKEEMNALEFSTMIGLVARSISLSDPQAQISYIRWGLDNCLEENTFFDRKQSIASIVGVILDRLKNDEKIQISKEYKDKYKVFKGNNIPSSLARVIRGL